MTEIMPFPENNCETVFIGPPFGGPLFSGSEDGLSF